MRLAFLPLHASWLNQIELWFSILERQCLKRASTTPTGRWLIESSALRVSGITLPGPFAGPSKAILSVDKWAQDLWDSALVSASHFKASGSSPVSVRDIV